MGQSTAGEWKDNFLSNTTRVGFNLKLTQPMMEYLCALSDDVHWDRRRYHTIFYPDNFLATQHALERRGLIQRKSPRLIKKDDNKDPWSVTFQMLTPAGISVVEMLKVGGLFIEAEEAAKKLSKRKGRN